MQRHANRVRTRSIERIGRLGLGALVLAHLVWDPLVTLGGVAAFGIGEEDSAVVRSLLRVHPGLWLAAKGAVVGGYVVLAYRLGAHRHPAMVWLPWALAAIGILAPLGWIELFIR